MNERTFLDWGLTSDWEVSGPRSRRSSLASAGASATPPPRAAAPAAVDEEETAGNSASEGAPRPAAVRPPGSHSHARRQAMGR